MLKLTQVKLTSKQLRMTLQNGGSFLNHQRKECVMHIDDIKNLYPNERLKVFANLNSSDLELLSHHANLELQERALVLADKEHKVDLVNWEDDLLAKQTANERLIWKDK